MCNFLPRNKTFASGFDRRLFALQIALRPAATVIRISSGSGFLSGEMCNPWFDGGFLDDPIARLPTLSYAEHIPGIVPEQCRSVFSAVEDCAARMASQRTVRTYVSATRYSKTDRSRLRS